MSVVETKYFKKLIDGRVQCTLCPRFCKMKEGQRGLCFVRGVEKGKLVLTSWGNASGYCVDPIEKKPLNHFLPGTSVLSFGQIGCNLTCSFCQNWHISRAQRRDPSEYDIGLLNNESNPEKNLETSDPASSGMNHVFSVNPVASSNVEVNRLGREVVNSDLSIPTQIAITANKIGCQSVALTYNDPIIYLEFAIDVARECHNHGLKTIAVTSGYICSKPREEFFNYFDAVNVDLKAFNQRFYYKHCSGTLEDVLDSLTFIKHKTDVWLEITTLLIPGENDSEEEIFREVSWIVDNLGVDVPLHFTRFHPDWKMMEKPITSYQTLLRAKDIALRMGIQHVYIGNVQDIVNASSYCQKCGNLTVGRKGYQIIEWNLNSRGECISCGSLFAGLVKGEPEGFGGNSYRVSLEN